MESDQPILQNILSMGNGATWQASIDLADQTVVEWLNGHKSNNFSRIVFIGCGTSLYNGRVGKYVVEHLAKIQAEALPSFTFGSYAEPSLLGPDTLVIGISKSGETQATCNALSHARLSGATTLALTATPGSSITTAGDGFLLTGGQSDQASAKTKSYIQALIAIYLLSIRLSEVRDVAGASLRKDWLNQVDLAAQGAAGFLDHQRAEIKQLAEQYSTASNVFILGSGPNLGTAGEASLKVVEMVKMFSEAQELENFLHGRISEVDQENPFFFIAPAGRSSERVLDFLTVTHQIGAPSIVLTDQATPGIRRLATHVIQMPITLDEFATPLLYILPLYLFAFDLAVHRSLDPGSSRYNIRPQKVRFVEE
ncbi:MAG: SIS domain-containing protein [Anaerolineaceae bacterium]|jgi:glucosamine--fructose-6-phosphate aminotransferase (isomerizing)